MSDGSPGVGGLGRQAGTNGVTPRGGYFETRWSDRVRFPKPGRELAQSEEWCELEEDGAWRRLRFHDYDQIYARPGLYEHLFYGLLECRSPDRVARLLVEVCEESGVGAGGLRVLDLGAGNGIVGQALRERGIEHVLGVDILPEAGAAARRDRPTVYDDYLVTDLTALPPDHDARIRAFSPTCLVSVAALGFGDVPPRAYFNALGYLPEGSLLAFNIKSEFLDPRYTFGFAELIRRMVEGGVIRFEATRRHKHRLAIDGTPLFYSTIIATKLKPVPESMLVER